ncbi:MAG: NAD-dependent epimerase/dehydratase family protein [bacterium]|nr:NAD-dependent epimerase/dehydratase family protein [bacterium]
MSLFKGKYVLVAGGTGMVGRQLVEILIDRGAHLWVASMDDKSRAHPEITAFFKTDLRIYSNCRRVCLGMDMVFNLLGVKGSPAVTDKYPEKFFYHTVMLNAQLMHAAAECGIKEYLYTSTNGVYAPASIMREDEMWQNPPSPHDKFAGWAKRMGELQAEACLIEYGMRTTIVRPSNIYGPYDNFDGENAMVVPSLIKKAVIAAETGQPMKPWGDGSPKRDFIHARDVARAMLLAVEKAPGQVLNVSSGIGTSIRELVEIIKKQFNRDRVLPRKSIEVIWNTSGPSGDNTRILDNTLLRSIGYQPSISLEEGIYETTAWYIVNRQDAQNRFDVFDKK